MPKTQNAHNTKKKVSMSCKPSLRLEQRAADREGQARSVFVVFHTLMFASIATLQFRLGFVLFRIIFVYNHEIVLSLAGLLPLQ